MAGKQEQITLSAPSIMAIAAACHAANAAFCRSIGDDSQPDWEGAPDWQQASAIDGVEFHLANPAAGDAASHENWLKSKEADGWQYGENKDPEKKLHPCMVPFDKLPPEQQFKDALFRTVVHAMAPALAELENDRNQLKRSLSAQKGAATKARAQVAELEEAKRPRKFGPVTDQLAPAELAELIGDAGKAELAFVGRDGREINGLAPRSISADGFDVLRGALRLQVPSLKVHGPAVGQTPFAVGGYALLVDGEQVAFAARGDVLSIGGGQAFELKDDAAFRAA